MVAGCEWVFGGSVCVQMRVPALWRDISSAPRGGAVVFRRVSVGAKLAARRQC